MNNAEKPPNPAGCGGVAFTNGGNGGIPLMITADMKRRLRELGYRDGEIREMTPEMAWALLAGVSDLPPGATAAL